MRVKQQSKRVMAWLIAMSLCLVSFWTPGEAAWAAADVGTERGDAVLSNPVIEAENGHVVWDCIYFGNYWQSEYIPQPGNRPEAGEDDVEHEDTDGTKYLVRQDKKCYKYEPVKWRVLAVSEDGTDAFVMADKTLNFQPYNTTDSDEVTWENASIRTWLDEEFQNKAFTDEEKEGIIPTEIENKKSPEYEGAEGEEEETPTTDRIYLPSWEEITSRAYGFTDSKAETETRGAAVTDFAGSDRVWGGNYWLRTISDKNYAGQAACLNGETGKNSLSTEDGIRPVLHLDLTKTELWEYAGKVKQDQTEIAPDTTPAVPTQDPDEQPGVTMAPGQVYPKNPVIHENDLKSNTWDCIYFGRYYNTKITPYVLAEAGEHNSVKEENEGEACLVRHEQGYFQYEPIKWRVLSINEDGTDAFLMAEQAIDLAQYFYKSDVEITWEKSDIRYWLNQEFMETAFTADEQAAVETTDVTTADNRWSGEAGGNATKDKVYLPSIEEMLNPDYGFSSDVEEGDTRRISATDYTDKGGTPNQPYAGALTYWLRSPGVKKGCPATVGDWGEGSIPTEPSVMTEKAENYIGVRPVMHVNLSDTTLWTYAGQVTPEGVVVPKEEEPEETPTPDVTERPAIPDQTPGGTTVQNVQPAQNPQVTELTQNPQTEVKKPGKPAIKKLKNAKGKKVTVTLSKKVSGASGYQVAYAAKSSMKGQKKKSFKGTSVTIKGLKKKKTYYFRVRAYTKKNGKTVYGSWSGKKSIKIKK